MLIKAKDDYDELDYKPLVEPEWEAFRDGKARLTGDDGAANDSRRRQAIATTITATAMAVTIDITIAIAIATIAIARGETSLQSPSKLKPLNVQRGV